jgi:hypothetical protein
VGHPNVHLLNFAIAAQMKTAIGDETTCNLTGWFNRDRDGLYLTIELSPVYRPMPIENAWERFLQLDDQEE